MYKFFKQKIKGKRNRQTRVQIYELGGEKSSSGIDKISSFIFQLLLKDLPKNKSDVLKELCASLSAVVTEVSFRNKGSHILPKAPH